MTLLHLWLADYGRAGVILAIGLAIGYPLCRRVLRGPTALPLMVLTGVAALTVLICLLAWGGMFTSVSVCAVALVAAAVSARCLAIDLRRWRAAGRSWRPDRSLLICLGSLAIVLLGISWFVLYPVVAEDAASYHLLGCGRKRS
jgi:glucose dehydrogenase